MPTARVMYYIGNKIKYSNTGRFSDDDFLMNLLNTPEAQKFAIKKYPWACTRGKLSYPPNEIHGMYNTYLDQLVVGRRTGDFFVDYPIDKIIKALEGGHVIMTSGEFQELKLYGHAFCLIGHKKNTIYLADPWGDWRSEYVNPRGYGIPMPIDEFVRHVKPAGEEKKWAHVTYAAISGQRLPR